MSFLGSVLVTCATAAALAIIGMPAWAAGGLGSLAYLVCIRVSE